MKTAILKNCTMTSNTLYGNVYDHPKFKDGTFVRTSEVKNVHKDSDYYLVTTRNTTYKILEKDMYILVDF